MRRIVAIGAACLVLGLLTVSRGLGQEAAVQPANLSADRSFGAGMQVGLPYGGLLSGRLWLSDRIGLEAIVFLGIDAYDVEGTLTGRLLWRLFDAEIVDFYLAAGAGVPLEEAELHVSVLGGIEFGFRFARNLSWNIEFGASLSTEGEFTMAVGTGIHFYFVGPEATAR